MMSRDTIYITDKDGEKAVLGCIKLMRENESLMRDNWGYCGYLLWPIVLLSRKYLERRTIEPEFAEKCKLVEEIWGKFESEWQSKVANL